MELGSYSGESSRSVPSAATNPEKIITITAHGRDGKWVSLFTCDIMGVKLEAVLSAGSGGSILSSRAYDLIKKKLSGNDRYKLKQINGIRIQDIDQNEMKLLGFVRIPCTIFGSCEKKSVTEDITFYVVENGAIDGVVGAPNFSAPVRDLVFQQSPKLPRVPRVLGKNPSTEEHSTQPLGSIVTDSALKKIEYLQIEKGQDSAELCYGNSDGGSQCVPPGANTSDEFVTITACGMDGKWPFLFKLDIMGVNFEAALSGGSEGSVLSSRVYKMIEKKLIGDDRYKLQQVPGIRIRDNFRREIKQLGAVQLPCTIFSNVGTKSVTHDIFFFVIEGGEIDCVVAKPARFQVEWNSVLLVNPNPPRFPRVMGRKPPTERCTQWSDSTVVCTIVGEKKFAKQKRESLQQFLSDETGETEELFVCDNKKLVYPVFEASALTREQISNALYERQVQDIMSSSVEVSLERSFRSEYRQNFTDFRSSPERVVTIIPMTREKHASMMKMKIANVAFEGVLSIGSGATVLSSRIYDRIVLETKNARSIRLEKTSGIKVCDTTGNEMKLLGELRVPCTFSSARGTNSVVEYITFLVVDGASVDCVFGKPEIFSCKISIILHRHLLIFNKHPSRIPIAMVGAIEDPDVAFKEEERKNLPAQHHVSPGVRIVSISLMTTTCKFPFMLKMDIVGVPFKVVLSTGSSGTVLSAKVYNRIALKTKDPRWKLQKATNVEVRDIMGNPMKLLGILDVPCRFICSRGENSVIDVIRFLVVENLIVDGVFGLPEIGSHNLCIRLEKGNSAVRFSNYEPPIEIAILET